MWNVKVFSLFQSLSKNSDCISCQLRDYHLQCAFFPKRNWLMLYRVWEEWNTQMGRCWKGGVFSDLLTIALEALLLEWDYCSSIYLLFYPENYQFFLLLNLMIGILFLPFTTKKKLLIYIWRFYWRVFCVLIVHPLVVRYLPMKNKMSILTVKIVSEIRGEAA